MEKTVTDIERLISEANPPNPQTSRLGPALTFKLPPYRILIDHQRSPIERSWLVVIVLDDQPLQQHSVQRFKSIEDTISFTKEIVKNPDLILLLEWKAS